ncbi:MAG: hypothetical protein EA352_06485 [Gemmatimonadales bacterium]|nr:MAG: hypothetical protein EA352_06485 [Gemmatimonadales bacterium]
MSRYGRMKMATPTAASGAASPKKRRFTRIQRTATRFRGVRWRSRGLRPVSSRVRPWARRPSSSRAASSGACLRACSTARAVRRIRASQRTGLTDERERPCSASWTASAVSMRGRSSQSSRLTVTRSSPAWILRVSSRTVAGSSGSLARARSDHFTGFPTTRSAWERNFSFPPLYVIPTGMMGKDRPMNRVAARAMRAAPVLMGTRAG